MSKLDSLSAVIHPCEIDVECCLNNTENNRDWVWSAVIDVKSAPNPVQNVKSTIHAQRKKIVTVDDCGNSCLAEKEELWQHADGFEYDREDPGKLFHTQYS